MPKPRCFEFRSKFGVFCSITPSKTPNFGVTKNSDFVMCEIPKYCFLKMPKKNIFVLLYFKGHSLCHTLAAGTQFTFKGQVNIRNNF